MYLHQINKDWEQIFKVETPTLGFCQSEKIFCCPGESEGRQVQQTEGG